MLPRTLPRFESNGNLPAGIHEATWSEFVLRFGRTAHRQELLNGLEAGLQLLKAAGCEVVYVDGSFTTDAEMYNSAPRDFDVCYEDDVIDDDALDTVFFDFSNGRAAQKSRFGGEFFPSQMMADHKSYFIEYFQRDRITQRPKGIVKILLATLP